MCGLAMTPRIILMTDGEPTDSAGSLEASITALALMNATLKIVIACCFICLRM